TGQNLTNASNATYHRQDATLKALVYGASAGVGVDISQVRRLINDALETALNGNTDGLSDTTQQLQTLRQLQTYLDPTGDGTDSLGSLLESFFNQAQQLSLQPDDLTQRRVVLATGQQLAGQLNSTMAAYDQAGRDLLQQGQQLVGEVNQLTS